MDTNDLPKIYSLDEKGTIDYVKDIFEDKLKLYHYCECQLSRVAFANSIFITAIAVLVAGDNSKVGLNIYTIILLFFFTLSLGITLWCALPKFFRHTPNYKNPDHRSLYGIDKFKNVKEYKKYISELAKGKIAEKTIYDEIIIQIYNMNDTIISDYRWIKIAVIFDFIGLSLFMLYIIFKFSGICKLIC